MLSLQPCEERLLANCQKSVKRLYSATKPTLRLHEKRFAKGTTGCEAVRAILRNEANWRKPAVTAVAAIGAGIVPPFRRPTWLRYDGAQFPPATPIAGLQGHAVGAGCPRTGGGAARGSSTPTTKLAMATLTMRATGIVRAASLGGSVVDVNHYRTSLQTTTPFQSSSQGSSVIVSNLTPHL